MSLMKHAVVYIPNRGVWQNLDHFGDEVGLHYNKKQAIEAARDFAKQRAKAAGNKVQLTVENKEGAVSKRHTYEP